MGPPERRGDGRHAGSSTFRISGEDQPQHEPEHESECARVETATTPIGRCDLERACEPEHANPPSVEEVIQVHKDGHQDKIFQARRAMLIEMRNDVQDDQEG
jgi:hypothetical protein